MNVPGQREAKYQMDPSNASVKKGTTLLFIKIPQTKSPRSLKKLHSEKMKVSLLILCDH